MRHRGITSCLTTAVFAVCALPAGAAPPAPTAAQLAGQRVIYPFPGTTPPDWLLQRIRRGETAGVLLFSGNGTRADDIRRLADRLQAVPRPAGLDAPLLVMIDQEGGPVRRINGPPVSGARTLGGLPVAVSARAGREAGRLLCRAGVNVDLAPVLDLARPGSVIAAQGRSFGADPAAVAARGLAFARGLSAYGVAAAPKHFPGLGAALRTTDEVPVRIGLTRRALAGADQRPYSALITAGVPMVMVGTAIYPSYGPRPAALSSRIVMGALRGRLGFEGVVVSDALDTPALAPVGDHAAVARQAAVAGTDLLLYSDPAAARAAADGLRRAITFGLLPHRSAVASAERIMALRRAVGLGQVMAPGARTTPPPEPGRRPC